MADILKISTPLVDKNPIQPNRPADPNVPFTLSDVTKVIQPGQGSEILKQNSGMVQQESAPTILMDLLKDPSVTVGFLKNIFMLQEIINLLPANNVALTQEIQQLFEALLVKPDEIVAELMRQEFASSTFKGELFGFLRNLIAQTPKPEMRYGVANLLKSLNARFSRPDILRSVSNSLQFLADSVKSSAGLSGRLMALSARFAAPDAALNFTELKDEALALFRDVEGSILYSPKLQKILPLVIYNLSRFNANPDFLREAVGSLLTLMDGGEQKQKFVELLHSYIESRETGNLAPGVKDSGVEDAFIKLLGRRMSAEEYEGLVETATARQPAEKEGSRVMDVLTRIIAKQSADADISLLSAEKIDKIVHSLLSSPCNFTPLLHFIIPVQDNDMRAFAELWIDPNSDEKGGGVRTDTEGDIHMLIVFDVDGIGRFETELFVRQNEIMLNLLCPPAYVAAFENIGADVARAVKNTPYRFKEIKIDKLERQRSLMDVFKTLPHKRTGVDVKV